MHNRKWQNMLTHLWEHDRVVVLATLFSLRKLMLALISNTYHKFRSDSASLPHLESRNHFKDLRFPLCCAQNLEFQHPRHSVANSVSSMEHQIKLHFNTNLHVYMRLWWETSIVSCDTLKTVFFFLTARLVTIFNLSSFRTLMEKYINLLFVFKLYKKQNAFFMINNFWITNVFDWVSSRDLYQDTEHFTPLTLVWN